ncbi:MAG TPA: hypothetical protein VFS83_14270 [Ktedonobacterales bacterium]|nr:hypothetical protein [Ktedonobacterales bacterium]
MYTTGHTRCDGAYPRRARRSLVRLLAGLIAYCHQPKKPSLHLDPAPALDIWAVG